MAYSSTQFQFTHLLQNVYSRLQLARSLVATGGGTTSIIDTTIIEEQQDDFTNWYAFVSRDAGGAGAAPEGEYKLVSAYDPTTFTLTTGTFSSAVGAGDEITLVNQTQVPLYDVMRLCREAIRNMDIPVRDTSLTTADNQTEYTIPIAAKGKQILYVEIQGYTEDANDNQWEPVPNWTTEPKTAGTAETLRIAQYAADYTLAVWYLAKHPDLTAYDSPISEYIPREYAISLCAYNVAKSRSAQFKDLLPFLIQDFNAAQINQPVTKYQRKVKGFPHWSTETADPSTVDSIRL